MPRFSYKALAVALCILYTIIFLSWLKNHNGFSIQPLTVPNPVVNDSLGDIQNATLGFEKVFAIGFGQRSDKHDAIILGASFTDIEVDWIEAVRSQDMSPKAYPPPWTEEKHREKPSELGSWRAHMNALQKIVEKKYGSAIIMEDDSDWDINIKSQLTEFARGTRAITNTTNTRTPYGDGWDMLWLGHCGMHMRNEERGEERTYYVIPHDPTAPPPQYRSDFFHPQLADFPDFENDRLIFVGEGAVCSWSVAFTYEGARKALVALSMVGLDEPVDLAYNFLCGGLMAEIPFNCLTSYPGITSTWRQRGWSSRDSDIVDTDDAFWHEASSNGIVYSTMLNLVPFANNASTFRAQWEDVSQPEINRTFEIPRGRLHLPDSRDVFV